MNKIPLTFLLMVFLIVACQTKDSNAITLEETLSLFDEEQMSLKVSNVRDSKIFGMKLNGVRPSFYELEGKLLLVYIYDSNDKREKGLQEFHNKTANFNVVSYKVYEVNNLLLFYVFNENLDIIIDNKILKIINRLNGN
ncbi:hypothetical protein KHA96_18605 [Bacillus sp. FJAT-49711]|uniref:hypothetical protein n=1 Tax=Bacillus sp. FJAT-49711 TaxID=2833585 RepID=UPI001BC9E68E|nr:hypothetical protein [Bacillus sp. FJAT-49711]MBS4220316.1 hypothetical protein [Bacillus sp. FJAT-49711]